MEHTHLAFERLVDLAEGCLSPELAAQDRLIAQGCPVCADQLTWLEQTIALMRADAEDPPAAAVAWVRALFRARRATRTRRTSALLRFDSAQAPLAFGMRSGAGDERQLIFAADLFELDVRISNTGKQWAVAGQVLGPETSGSVELAGPASTAQAALNDLCEFRLPPVLAGVYTLTLRLADLEVAIPDLELGS